MKVEKGILTVLIVVLALGGTQMLYGQGDDYARKQAAERSASRRERQQERAQHVQSADIDSDVAAETAAYMEELARVQRKNNKIADYMTNDLHHRIAFWGDLGLSYIRPKNMAGLSSPVDQYTTPFLGGGVGVGYQLLKGKFLFTTGIDLQYAGSTLFSRDKTHPLYPNIPYTSEMLNCPIVDVPLLFGMELSDWYWLLGAKVGVEVNNFPVMARAAGEIGMNFDRWTRPQVQRGVRLTDKQRTALRMHYKLALFADYSMLGDATAGLKFTAAYQFRKRQRQMEPLPTRVRPRMTTVVVDEHDRPLDGAMVEVYDRVTSGTSHGTTTADGSAPMRVARGEYELSAHRQGYTGERRHVQHVSADGDTVVLRMRRLTAEEHAALREQARRAAEDADEGTFVVDPDAPELVGSVVDAETHAPLEASVRFGNWKDTTALYRGTANARGRFVTRLHKGDYSVRVRHAGYMPLIDAVHFEADSMRFALKPIRVGSTMRVRDVFFVKDRGALSPESETGLANIALFLRQNPDVCVRITVQASGKGDEDKQERMALSRARAIRRNVVNRGIDINRIEIDGAVGTSERIVVEVTSVTGVEEQEE